MSAHEPLLETVSHTTSLRNNGEISETPPTPTLDHQIITMTKYHEIYLLLKMSLPIFLSVFCEWIPELVAFIIIGHSIDSSTNLSIVALSFTFYNFILFIVWGLLSGLYTLIQDIYKKQYEHGIYGMNMNMNIESDTENEDNIIINRSEYYIKLYSQRAFIITLIISIPFVIILSYGGTILVSLGMDKSFELNINFVCCELIGTLYISLWKSITQRIIESLPERSNTNKTIFYFNLCGALLSFPISWIFILFLDLGFKGFAIVITICNVINLILIIILLYCKNYGFIFKPLTMNKLLNLKGIKQYLQLSFPGMIIALLENSTSYLIVLLSGFININGGNVEIAICSAFIIILIIRFLQFIFTAISYSLSIRIGGYIYMECLGKYNHKEMINKAKETRNIGYLITLMMNLIISFFLYFLKQEILSIFINNQQIIDLCMTLINILIIHSFIMSFEYLLSAICRSFGEPFVVWPAPIILCSYYIIPFPLMLISLFLYGYNKSLYYGTIILFSLFAISKAICVIIMQLLIYWKIDWNKVSQKKHNKHLVQLQFDQDL